MYVYNFNLVPGKKLASFVYIVLQTNELMNFYMPLMSALRQLKVDRFALFAFLEISVLNQAVGGKVKYPLLTA